MQGVASCTPPKVAELPLPVSLEDLWAVLPLEPNEGETPAKLCAS